MQLVTHLGSVHTALGLGHWLDAKTVTSALKSSAIAAGASDVLVPPTVGLGIAFKPSAVGTVLFLLLAVQIVSIPLGAYLGAPFLPGTVLPCCPVSVCPI